MERMKKALNVREKGEGILSVSLATFGSRDYREFEERVDMLVEAGINQLLLITYNPEIFRIAEIAPAEQHMVNLGIAGGKYQEMFVDNVQFVRNTHPDLPVIVTPMIGDVISFGIPNFVRLCQKAGVDAMDTAQYPAIKDPVNFRRRLEEAGIGFICAVNGGAVKMDDPHTLSVMDELVRITSGELFYVPAIPGTQNELKGTLFRPYIDRIREVQNKSGNHCPIVSIGGINTAEQAYEQVHIAGVDGVHFSSAFMKRIFAEEPLEKIEIWLREVKEAMKG